MTTASLRTFVWTANCSLTDELQSDSCTAFWWPDCFSARLTRAPPGSRSITPWSRPLAANRTRKKKKISFSNEHFSDKCEDCTPGPLRVTEPSCPSHPHLHLPPHPPDRLRSHSEQPPHLSVSPQLPPTLSPWWSGSNGCCFFCRPLAGTGHDSICCRLLRSSLVI